MNTDSTASRAPLTVTILGLGSMGRAILSGLLATPDLAHAQLRVTNSSAAKAAEWDDVERVTAFAVESNPQANQDAVREAEVVILAVKPWQVLPLLDEVASGIRDGAVVVCVAAGITTAAMEAHLPPTVSVIRAMPNTPSIIQQGVTGLAAGSHASEAAVALALTLFASIGAVVVVPESQIDAVTAVSGSGPAYVFLIAESMMQAARELGFSDEDAQTLVLGTLAGASALAAQSEDDPRELRRKVTSPKGTTEQGVSVLESAQLPELFEQVFNAALNRAEELSREND